jgi:RHS repeat-associated protein
MYDAQGERIWAAELDIYGNVRTQTGNRSLCPFRYPGQYEDLETGLHYNRFRYYDPQAGGYISQDPIGLAGGNPTLYGYVEDPNGWVDPWGLACDQTVTHGKNGRVETVTARITPADLGKGTGTNASSRARARKLGHSTDDAGHTIGNQLGGKGGVKEIFPQNPHVNRGKFAQHESAIAEYVERTQQPVDIVQKYHYGNGGTRPTRIEYTTSQNGNIISSEMFDN